MNKEDKIRTFNPNSVGQRNDGMYGLPFTAEECDIILIPVPWEVTVSYGGGTANAPHAILEASYQVDLFDPVVAEAWKYGIAMDEINNEVRLRSDELRHNAEKYIDALAQGASENNDSFIAEVQKIHDGGVWLNEWVKERVNYFLRKEKIVGLVGGDHSTPLGMIHAMAEKYPAFGILQIDAHADLRDAYEGFEFSHASIMFNALKTPQVQKLVQVGIRDYCEEEFNLISSSLGRVTTFFDRDIRHDLYCGDSWDRICNRIVAELPENVYLSFDIDGLDPKLCPNTGTPVAGGFEVEQVLFLLEKVVKSGRRIIAFDLNEVTPGESDWDANVAARLLYRISNLVALSNRK